MSIWSDFLSDKLDSAKESAIKSGIKLAVKGAEYVGREFVAPAVKEVYADLAPKVNKAYTEHVAPKMKKTYNEYVEPVVTDTYNQYVKPVLNDVSTRINEMAEKYFPEYDDHLEDLPSNLSTEQRKVIARVLIEWMHYSANADSKISEEEQAVISEKIAKILFDEKSPLNLAKISKSEKDKITSMKSHKYSLEEIIEFLKADLTLLNLFYSTSKQIINADDDENYEEIVFLRKVTNIFKTENNLYYSSTDGIFKEFKQEAVCTHDFSRKGICDKCSYRR